MSEQGLPGTSSTTPASADIADEATGLLRVLSHRQTRMIGLGSALGTGLFLGSASAISEAGPAVIIAYIAGAALIAIIGFALGEMTSVHPSRGAFGAIAARYVGPWAGFLARWSYWAAAVIAIGGDVVAAAMYVRFWWPQIPTFAAIVVLAAAVLGINLVSVNVFGTAEFWLSSIKITALLVFLITGSLLVFVGLPHSPATGFAHLTEDGGFFPHGAGAIWLVMPVVMFAFIGTETISIAAAETRDPTRSIRTAMRSMIWRLGLFYVASVLLIVSIFSWRSVSVDDESVQSSPFVQVFADVGIPAAASVTNAVVLIAAISAANANLYNSSRLLHSLGEERLAPAPVARLSRRGVPLGALVLSTSGLAVAAALAASGVGDVFTVLIALATFAILIVWLLILASYLAFRRQRRGVPAVPGRLRMWGGAATGGVGVVGLLAVMATVVVVPDMQLAATAGLIFTAVLLVCYWVSMRRRRRVDDNGVHRGGNNGPRVESTSD